MKDKTKEQLIAENVTDHKRETSFIVTITPSSTFLRPVQTWIDTPQRLRTLKRIEMGNRLLLLFDQAA